MSDIIEYVICIDNTQSDYYSVDETLVSIGRKYRVISEHTFSYWIIDNNNLVLSVSKEKFVSEEEYRKLKLKKICSKLEI